MAYKREPVGARMRDVRERYGVTQEQMAKVFRVTRNTINRWEHGRTNPWAPDYVLGTLDHLEGHLKALGGLLEDGWRPPKPQF